MSPRAPKNAPAGGEAMPADREAWLLMSDLVLDHGRGREVTDALGISFGRARAVRRVRALSAADIGALRRVLVKLRRPR
jgi:hypothetical protein